VVWLADEPIPGAPDAVCALVDHGERVVLVSNNSFATLGEYREKLDRSASRRGRAGDSAMAAATLVEPGERVLVCGGPGIVEASRGAVHGRGQRSRTERRRRRVVGLHRDFDYERLRRATSAVRGGRASSPPTTTRPTRRLTA